MAIRTTLAWAAVSAAAVLLAGQVPAHATLSSKETHPLTPLGPGVYGFRYRVNNSSTSTVDIGEFDLQAAVTADLSSISIPTGFLSLYTPGDVDVSFQSTGASTDIQPGMTDTFSFVSEAGPAADLDDTFSFDDFSVVNGTTVGPTAVPEPASAALLAVGAIALRRRRRASR